MRVMDLDRDMSDVIPTGTTPDSEFLFARMTERTLDLARPGRGARILDVASGVGQDAIALAERGAEVVAAEPSKRMSDMAQLFAEQRTPRAGARAPLWIRCWSDRIPFATGSFDAVICKGALDHFDRPQEALAEMARVASSEGRVVLAVANFESLACRVGRARDDLREQLLRRSPQRGRRGYDAPSDHFTRYELDLMREQASQHLELEVVEGVSMGWGLPGWSGAVARLPAGAAVAALQALDWLARRAPGLADVVVLAGRPRRCASISA
jgi:SAM-dependent methyltransferase